MAFSFKKFKGMLVIYMRTQLGMTIDTRLMECSVPETYLIRVRTLMKEH